MADEEAARRREIRRRRILENAEERKKKIFGTNTVTTNKSNETDTNKANNNSDETVLQNSSPSSLNDSSLTAEGSVKDVSFIQATRTQLPPDTSLLQNSVSSGLQNSVTSELQSSTSSGLQNSVASERQEHNRGELNRRSPSNFRVENGIESVPEITEHLRNINNLLTASGGGGTSFSAAQTRKFNNAGSDVQSAPIVVGALSTPIVPVILALFVCILLSVKLDYVVSNSIALPFLLWEAQHLWCNRQVIEASSRGVGGLLGLALVLCGIQQSVIVKMTQITTVMKCVFEDFAFYILTIVVWYWMIGLPGSVRPVDEFAEPHTVQVTATSEDVFDNMDDF